jgi:hypothetical protein
LATTITASATTRAPRRPFFVALSGVIALIAVVGFCRLHFGPLVVGTH